MIDACRNERLADATSSRVRRNTEHPDRAGIRVIDLAEGRLTVDECDAADKATPNFRDQNLTAGNSPAHVAQLLLVELVSDIAECSISLDDQLTGGVVFLRSDPADDDRLLPLHPAILSTLGRESRPVSSSFQLPESDASCIVPQFLDRDTECPTR